MPTSEHSDHLATKCIHAGQPSDPISGAVCVPISMATTFEQKSPGVHTGFEYSRTGNPTRQAYENCVAELEGGKYGLAFASGSCTTATIVHLLKSGEHLVSIDDVYGGTNRYLTKVAMPSMGIKVSFVDLSVTANLKNALTESTKLVWIETPTNPTLKLCDIQEVCRIAHEFDPNLIVCVDNTFMSPYFQQPLQLGADIVVHSVTKFINGHSDVVGGVAVTSNKDIYDRLKFLQNSIGPVPSPFDCYMVLRGIKTLHLRMERHAFNAQKVAELLSAHEKVERVIYPGLKSHPQHELATRQMSGYGGMVTFFLKGDISHSRTFLESLSLFTLAESLGAVESLAEHPAIMTHASVPPDQRAALGISDSLIRLSVGVEAIEDITKDLEQALEAVRL